MRLSFVFALLLVTFATAGSAGPLEQPLPPGAKVLRAETVSIGPTGSSSTLIIPQRGTVRFDYEVEPGKTLRLGILTEAQFQEASAGHKIAGSPVMNITISGSGSKSIVLDKGTYAIPILPNGSPDTRVSYRASYRR